VLSLLPCYAHRCFQLGAAISWGQIADIAYQRGNYDEAAELQHKRLEANRKLADPHGIAAASWDLARIDLARQDYQGAFPRLAESFQISSGLQQPDGIPVVGITLGQLLLAAREPDQAHQVLSASLDAATKLGRSNMVHQINGC